MKGRYTDMDKNLRQVRKNIKRIGDRLNSERGLMIRSSVDVPVVVTVANADTNYRHRIEDGAAILNVAAGAQTPEIVAEIRERFPDYPILATGGADDESIRATIRAGANAIIWTPPTSGELFRDVMKNYREGKPHP